MVSWLTRRTPVRCSNPLICSGLRSARISCSREPPLLLAELAVASRAGSSAIGLLLRSARPISTVIRSAVASELAGDGAAVPSHESRHRGDREGRHLSAQRGERIPLLGGDLVIMHDDSFLAEDSSVSQIASALRERCCT